MKMPKPFDRFDVDRSTISVWLFWKGRSSGGSPRFKASWVDTDEALDDALRGILAGELERIQEVREYGLLAENNASSALGISLEETHGQLIVEKTAAPTAALRIRSQKEALNTVFYVVKFNDAKRAIYAIRKTDGSWRSRFGANAMPVLFSGTRLKLNRNPGFFISRSIDFLIIGDDIWVANKGHFESILEYKQAHLADFENLRTEEAFKAVFVSIDPFVSYVGANKLHLRRACAIKDKGYYKNAVFLKNLRDRHKAYGLALNFDAAGRIVVTEESCADVMRALLDHRLHSPFSDSIYDVEDAVPAPSLPKTH